MWYYKKPKKIPTKNSEPRNGTRLDAIKADENIYFCKNCNHCWQIDWEESRSTYNRKIGKVVYKHYDNFPTFKKKRKTCNICEEKNAMGNRSTI